MSSMNQRFRKLVGSTRRSSNNSVATQNSTSSTLSPPQPAPTTNGTSSAATSVNSTATSQSQNSSSPAPAAPSASSTSLATMNPGGQQPLGRPPSYQYANQGNSNLGAPQHPNQGRPSSPMPPPPINTGGGHAYAPQHQQQMYAPQPNAPPGYPMQNNAYGYGAPPQHGAPQGVYGRQMAEVEGSQRSKAQLIVGIDFVCIPNHSCHVNVLALLTDTTGYHVLRCSLRVCDQY